MRHVGQQRCRCVESSDVARASHRVVPQSICSPRVSFVVSAAAAAAAAYHHHHHQGRVSSAQSLNPLPTPIITRSDLNAFCLNLHHPKEKKKTAPVKWPDPTYSPSVEQEAAPLLTSGTLPLLPSSIQPLIGPLTGVEERDVRGALIGLKPGSMIPGKAR